MSKPNFVIIMTDSQGANIIESYCGQKMRTPNIDKLADEGIKFERGYTTCPLCTPARASLFTGIYPHTSGPWTNNIALGENIKTMGQRFSDVGYNSAYVGKWHLDGHDYFGTGICPEGWNPDYWYDGLNYLQELNDQEIHDWRQGLNNLDEIKEKNITEEFTWANGISNRSIDFLQKQNKDNPFCLVVAYDEPHHPYTCPPEFIEPFNDFEYDIGPAGLDDLKDKPSHQKEWSNAMHNKSRDINNKRKWPMYFGCNSYIDYEIGRVLNAVNNHCSENTYIIYTSDHGDMIGAHQLESKGCASYEEITHIPFIIKTPNLKLNKKIDNSIVSHIDILPTMLDLAGESIPPILEGESIVSILEGKESNIQRSAIIEFNRYEIEHDSFGGFKPLRAIVSGDYKLTINLLTSDELYNLEDDPGETVNLIERKEYSDIRNNLHKQLLEWMYKKRDPFRGPDWERRPWQKNRNLSWMGLFRPRPADGYAPPVRVYDTAQPEVKVRNEMNE
jgi:uncharacterized sulfatase